MRAFLALDIPDKIRKKFEELQRNLKQYNVKDINWVAPENFHITLQFVKDLNENDLEEIIDFLEREFQNISQVECFNFTVNFDSNRLPRIIWIEFEIDDKSILKLQKRFFKKLITMGYPIEKKTFKPHVTLGRIKKRLPDFFIQKILTTELIIEKIEVSEATIYRSILRPEGPQYDTVEKFNFSKE